MSELIERLRQLAKAVTEGPEGWHREFTMRVPAEPKRDADLVISTAADELERELNEQARCNGMGSEREAALMTKVERLERENERLNREWRIQNSCIADQHDKLAAAQATIQQMRAHMKNAGSSTWWCQEAERLVTLPADRTALDAMLAEARKDQAEKIERLENDIRWRDKEILMLRAICVKRDTDAIRQAAERSE